MTKVLFLDILKIDVILPDKIASFSEQVRSLLILGVLFIIIKIHRNIQIQTIMDQRRVIMDRRRIALQSLCDNSRKRPQPSRPRSVS